MQEIEKLLEKYYNGETSLDEERELRKFFSSGEVPARWKHLGVYFAFTGEEKELRLENPEFDARISNTMEGTRISKILDFQRPWIYWVAGVAASVLILVAIFVKFDPFSTRLEDTYENPEVAYVQAKKVLLYVSSKMSNGTKNLEPVGKFSQGLSEVQPVASYNKSLSGIEKLSEVDKVKNILSNN